MIALEGPAIFLCNQIMPFGMLRMVDTASASVDEGGVWDEQVVVEL